MGKRDEVDAEQTGEVMEAQWEGYVGAVPPQPWKEALAAS